MDTQTRINITLLKLGLRDQLMILDKTPLETDIKNQIEVLLKSAQELVLSTLSKRDLALYGDD